MTNINHLCRVLREQVRTEVQLPPAPRLQPQGLLLPFQGQAFRKSEDKIA